MPEMMDYILGSLLGDAGDGSDDGSGDESDQPDQIAGMNTDMSGMGGMLGMPSTDPQDLMTKLMMSIGGGPEQVSSPTSVLRNRPGDQQGGMGSSRGSSGGGNSQQQPRGPRVSSLRELGQIAQMTKALPPELRNMIMSKVLGLEYQVPKYGQQISREKTANAALGLRSNMLDRTLSNRTNISNAQIKQRQTAAGDRQSSLDAYRDKLVKQKKTDAKNNVAKSIAILSKHAEDADVGSKHQMDLMKMIQQQHRLYDQMNSDDQKKDDAEVERNKASEGEY